MLLYTFGGTRFDKNRRCLPLDTDHKPGGLWLTEDRQDGWKNHVIKCIDDNPSEWCRGDLRYVTAFEIDPARLGKDVLAITGKEDILTFAELYGETPRRNCKDEDLVGIRNQCIARCSSQGRCLQPGGGSSPADAAVWTPVIVIREKPRQRIEPFIIGVVRALVGPLSLHDLVERLRLAIGLRPERPRALQPYVPGRRRAGEAAAHVAGAVVGQDALDGDALALEVGQSPDKEGGSSRAAFVR